MKTCEFSNYCMHAPDTVGSTFLQKKEIWVLNQGDIGTAERSLKKESSEKVNITCMVWLNDFFPQGYNFRQESLSGLFEALYTKEFPYTFIKVVMLKCNTCRIVQNNWHFHIIIGHRNSLKSLSPSLWMNNLISKTKFFLRPYIDSKNLEYFFSKGF